MSARRALPEDQDEITLVVQHDSGRARRAQQPCRRALAADAHPTRARRALVVEEFATGQDTKIMPKVTASTAPFVRRSAGFTARKLIATAGIVAAVGSFSGAALAYSAAQPVASAPSVSATAVQVSEREVALSRAAQRPALTSHTTEPAVEAPAPAPEIDIAGTIAPGQLTPLSVDEAMARAAEMTGNWGYDNMCLSLVATFYGYSSSGAIGAQQAADVIIAAGQMHTDLSDIPVGALIWYDGTPVGNPYGHVAMYAGDGMVYSNGAPTGVGLIPLHEPADGWGEPIIGWSTVWLPAATQ